MKDNLFGIKALETCFRHLQSIHNASIGQYGQNWQDKNIQTKKAKKKNSKRKLAELSMYSQARPDICPHYNLIELCAEIMDIKPAELAELDHFCGILRKDIMLRDIEERNRRIGRVQEISFRCCSAIRYIMYRQLELVKTKKPKPITQISESPSEDEKKKVQEFFEADEKFKAGQQILNLWKKTISKNIGTEKAKYSDKELILQIENLLKQLEKQAAGNSDIMYIFTGFEDHLCKVPCPSAPKCEI